MKLLLLFLSFLTLAVPMSSQTAPFTLVNPRNKPFPLDEAVKIYDTAVAVVTQDIKPARTQPSLVVTLGVKGKPQVKYARGQTFLTMDNYSTEVFTQAAVWAAVYGALPWRDVPLYISRTMNYTSATVSVKDLQKGR